MATLIQAFAHFARPVLTPKTIGLDVLSTRLIDGSLVTRSIARIVLEDLTDAVLVGLREVNAGQLPGTVIRREDVGLTTLDIVALWDEVHPEDPYELPPNFRAAA